MAPTRTLPSIPLLLLLAVLAVPSAAIVAEGVATWHGSPFVVDAVERLVGPICHHLPERSFRRPDGALAPVCARCAGLYSGWLVGALIGLGLGFRSRARSVRALLAAGALGLAAAGAALLEHLALLESAGLLQTSNAQRWWLGLPLGLLPACLLGMAVRVLWDDCRPGPNGARPAKLPPTS